MHVRNRGRKNASGFIIHCPPYNGTDLPLAINAYKVYNTHISESDSEGSIMSQTISLRLPDELISRLDRFARMLGNGTTRTRASVILLDEALREEEFAGIEFHNTSIGRQPFVKQTGMAVWEFIMIGQ